jgi:hypothetical protein
MHDVVVHTIMNINVTPELNRKCNRMAESCEASAICAFYDPRRQDLLTAFRCAKHGLEDLAKLDCTTPDAKEQRDRAILEINRVSLSVN